MADEPPKVSPLKLIRGGGRTPPLFGGEKVKSIYRHGLCEDNETVMVIAVLENGRYVAISVCPGRPITACEIEVEFV